MRGLTIHGAGQHGNVVGSTALLLGFTVRYTDAKYGTDAPQERWCFIAIGDNAARKACNRKLLVTLAHPESYVDRSAQLMPGVFVGPRAMIHCNARVGRGAIVNSGAIVEHDCMVGDWAHIAPGAILCGSVDVGEGAFIGAGSVIKQGIRIAPWSVIGAGAVVVRDIDKPGTFVGVPARLIKGE